MKSNVYLSHFYSYCFDVLMLKSVCQHLFSNIHNNIQTSFYDFENSANASVQVYLRRLSRRMKRMPPTQVVTGGTLFQLICICYVIFSLCIMMWRLAIPHSYSFLCLSGNGLLLVKSMIGSVSNLSLIHIWRCRRRG